MAIIVPQQQRKTNWFAILVFVFLLLVILGGGYFLFFAPTPGIEIITPTPLESAEKLSQVKLDPSKIINDPILKTFRQYGTVPSTGNVGRPNPFIAP